ncbi:hypothetical protein SAMN02746009_02465 [Hymenobacter psychrotolerans DSM 18569]|uniref:Uncharacterized protein n=2 Tax=Hymenobacter psychrotolerans TaxID=344998 RepID=A0A1M6Z9L4_9BACT|nr:hypothetical protein SAMN02746009_02465 [Hymenobacter psychrotolerans DSM 18569]
MILNALQELAQCAPEIQLHSLAWAHRSLKQRCAHLNRAKLLYYEQGHADAWQCQYEEARADLALIENALEAAFPAPSLPAGWAADTPNA